MKRTGYLTYGPIILVIGAAVLFHLVTVPDGHDWGGDFSHYIIHARNLATGQPYAQDGYINYINTPFSPVTRPPVFPLLLAPVYFFFGLNLYAMKLLIIASILVLLIIFYKYCCGRLASPINRLMAVGFVGFSPWMWEFNHQIVSEIPFMVFLFTSFYFANQWDREDIDERRRSKVAVATGVVMFLACGTRSAGILLVPALVAGNFLRLRRLDRATIIATLAFGGLYIAKSVLFHSETNYLARSVFSWDHILPNMEGYYMSALGYWGEGFAIPARKALIVSTGLLALTGFLVTLRQRCSTSEFFLILYPILILPYYGFGGMRFLLPLIPLYIMYIFCGIEAVPSIGRFPIKKYLAFCMAGIMAYSYVDSYSFRNFNELQYGVETKESVEVFDFIRRKTPEDSVFMFFKPRVLVLFTGRKAEMYRKSENPHRNWNYLEQVGATHILVKYHSENLAVSDVHLEGDRVLNLIDPYLKNLTLIFENEQFRIYRIDHKNSDSTKRVIIEF